MDREDFADNSIGREDTFTSQDLQTMRRLCDTIIQSEKAYTKFLRELYHKSLKILYGTSTLTEEQMNPIHSEFVDQPLDLTARKRHATEGLIDSDAKVIRVDDNKLNNIPDNNQQGDEGELKVIIPTLSCECSAHVNEFPTKNANSNTIVVSLGEEINLPPNSEVFCYGIHNSSLPCLGTAIVEPFIMERPEIIIANVLFTHTNNKEVPLRIMNLSEQPVLLQKSISLGVRLPMWKN